jgi:hypothetical protein
MIKEINRQPVTITTEEYAQQILEKRKAQRQAANKKIKLIKN